MPGLVVGLLFLGPWEPEKLADTENSKTWCMLSMTFRSAHAFVWALSRPALEHTAWSTHPGGLSCVCARPRALSGECRVCLSKWLLSPPLRGDLLSFILWLHLLSSSQWPSQAQRTWEIGNRPLHSDWVGAWSEVTVIGITHSILTSDPVIAMVSWTKVQREGSFNNVIWPIMVRSPQDFWVFPCLTWASSESQRSSSQA